MFQRGQFPHVKQGSLKFSFTKPDTIFMAGKQTAVDSTLQAISGF
jgi:hypothetical protein